MAAPSAMVAKLTQPDRSRLLLSNLSESLAVKIRPADRHSRSRAARCLRLLLAAPLLGLCGAAAPAQAQNACSLHFSSDVDWIKTPAGKLMGEVSAVAIDARDHLWVLHRPRTIAEADRARALPAVVEFDPTGRFVQAFGGPDEGYDWPTVEHSIAVDKRGHIWVAGSYRAEAAKADDMIVELTRQGKFVRQIGARGASKGNADTASVHAPGDLYVDDKRNELYVADGYGNRRLIVFDARTGAFRRMWSAFGKAPPMEDAPPPRKPGEPFAPETGEGPEGFNGVHGVRVSNDGIIYVSDRNNQRIQLFTRSGRYLRQMFVDRNMTSAQTASGMAFSRDSAQRYLYVADFGNTRMLVFDRKRLKLVSAFGAKGSGRGQFTGPHLIAVNSKGDVFVAEVQGRRVQRLSDLRLDRSATPSAGARLTVEAQPGGC